MEPVLIRKKATSAFSDLATAAWPIAIVWTLHMRLQKKIYLMTLFALTVVYVSRSDDRKDRSQTKQRIGL